MAEDDPVPVIFESKGIYPNSKDARFTFHTRRAVQSAIADLIVYYNYGRNLSCVHIPIINGVRINHDGLLASC